MGTEDTVYPSLCGVHLNWASGELMVLPKGWTRLDTYHRYVCLSVRDFIPTITRLDSWWEQKGTTAKKYVVGV
jgi:hypothetical protein